MKMTKNPTEKTFLISSWINYLHDCSFEKNFGWAYR